VPGLLQIAALEPERFLLGHLTSIQQLPLLTEWASFPGDNSLKIIEVIRHHIEGLVTGKRTAEQVMPELVGAVSNLLPKCGG